MDSYKAPGLDGFGACFYQYHWSVVGVEVTIVVLFYLNGSYSVADINHTYPALIPKKQQAMLVND